MAVQNGIDSKQALQPTSNVTFNAATLTTPLAASSGGTGVANSNTITLGGNVTTAGALTTSGAFSSTFTMTGGTAVTFPTSGTLATTSQIPATPISLANGGTGAALVADNGGIFYSNATTGAILAHTATANQPLLSGASGAPGWSTATYPGSTTINQILYSSAANTVTGLATANGGVLTTSATGVPSIDTTNFSVLTTGVQMKGNNTNTAPPAGFIGEIIVATATGVAVVNNTPKTIASITLTPGVWDICANFAYNGTITGTAFACGIATVTNSTTGWVDGDTDTSTPVPPTAAVSSCLSLSGIRKLVSANTTYYLTALALFSVGTLTANVRVSGVRVG